MGSEKKSHGLQPTRLNLLQFSSNRMKSFHKISIWLAVALGMIIFFSFQLGRYPLLDPDEPRYAASAEEMLHTGNWNNIFFNGKVRWDKPPVFYWLIASAVGILGSEEWVIRLPSVLAALGILTMLAYMMYQKHGLEASLFSVIILATMVEFYVVGRLAITDMTLAFWITASLFFFYQVIFLDKTYSWIGIYMAMAMAMLTKGPIGFILPALVMGGTLLALRSKIYWKKCHCFLGLGLMMLITIPWFGLQIHQYGHEYADYFFLKHNVGRFLNKDFGHEASLGFVPLITLVGGFPWTLFLPFTVYAVWKNFKIDSNRNLNIFFLMWFLIPVVFFTLAKAKLPTYILPIFVPLAYFISLGLGLLSKEKALFKNTIGIYVVLLVFCVAGVICLNIYPLAILENVHVPLWVSIVPLWSLSLGLALWIQKRINPVYCIAFTMVYILCVVVHFGFPEIAKRKSLGELMIQNKTVLNQSDTIASFYLNRPSMVFYTKRHIQTIADVDHLYEYLSQHGQHVCIMKKDIYDSLLPNLGKVSVVIDEKYGRLILKNI